MSTLLSLTRLPVVRQRNVTRELAEVMSAKARKGAPSTLRPLIESVIAAGDGLSTTESSALAVDIATDQVVAGLYGAARAFARGLPDTVIVLSPEQQRLRAAGETIIREAFVRGTSFVRRPMDLEYDALVKLTQSLDRPAVATAVETLGLRPMVSHLKAHLTPYGYAIKNTAGDDVGTASALWHSAFIKLAGAVPTHDDPNGTWEKTLLGPYLRELKAHKDDIAKVRSKNRSVKSKGETL